MANGYLYVYFIIEWCEKAENINKKNNSRYYVKIFIEWSRIATYM